MLNIHAFVQCGSSLRGNLLGCVVKHSDCFPSSGFMLAPATKRSVASVVNAAALGQKKK